ncbi:MAG TPA: phenylalanine--tRNA ligase subunit beta [Prosthecobacter sp.]|nr:phenylalanine--tRNA ligase subunit beta [Prosthecobacter sp.]
MQVSLSWLSQHLDLTGYSTAQLSDLLTFAGIEVEGIEEKGVASDKVVIAQIKESVQHPDADKLSVCQVDDGSGSLRQIVCGAKNFKTGDKVPLALPGAVLPGGFEIKEGKLRGVVSGGMMCSGKELGLGDDHAGLLILDPDLPIGKPFKEVVPADTVFDLEITPNRPDLLSHLGLARELAALTGLPLKSGKDHSRPESKARSAKETDVFLQATDGCPYYTARVVKGVKVGPSPEWLKARLESVGLRPINNIVDITNYVLMEMGQPLHAFDLAKLTGGIAVRRATEGEIILALDGAEQKLLPEDLVIADNQRPVAIAGVMGGEETGVTESTSDILLESAYFTPSGIRRTSRRLGLHTDSSYRFERGVDPQQVHGASDLATRLILEIAGGTAEDTLIAAGEAPVLAAPVTLDEQRAHRLLGIPDLTTNESHAILTKLGLAKQSGNAEHSTWTIPSYRLDLQRSVDLVEELARVIGLERVPSKFTATFASGDATDRQYDHAMQLRQALAHRGFNEAQTLRLIATNQLTDSLGSNDPIAASSALKNPLSEDHTTLRPSIVPGLIASAALNIRQGAARLRLFELGRVFLKLPNGQTREEERLAILLSGPVSPASWHAREPRAADFSDLRGLVESLPGAGTLEARRLADTGTFLLHSDLRSGNRVLGWIAQLHPARARQIDARHPVYVAELLLSALRQGSAGPAKFTDLPRFPAITRDVAMELPADLPHAKVSAFFTGIKEPLLIKADLFDVFSDPTGTKLPKDRKSVAWTLTYRALDKTLETAEVDAAHARILAAVEKALPTTIRR